ncbi:MAG: DUF3467 domain-containing protein [Bryobacteraceae bacterium]
MSNENSETPNAPIEPRFEYIEAREGVHNVYSNHLQALWTTDGVRIRYGELIKISGEPSERLFTIEDRAAITLAWTQAKYLHAVLSDIISRYEALNGEIKPPTVP